MRTMKVILTTLLCCLLYSTGLAQSRKKVSLTLMANHSRTLNDYNKVNNEWLFGMGALLALNTGTKFKPVLEIAGDKLIYGKDVLKMNPDGSPGSNSIRYVVNGFAGASFHPIEHLYVSFTGGPSYINEKFFVGIKPAIGVYFTGNQRWSFQFSYTNVFNRTKIVDQDFETLNLALAVRLF